MTATEKSKHTEPMPECGICQKLPISPQGSFFTTGSMEISLAEYHARCMVEQAASNQKNKTGPLKDALKRLSEVKKRVAEAA